MSDDLSKKLKQFTDMLSSENNIPDNLKGLLNLIKTSSNQETEATPQTDTQKSSNTDNLDMMRTLQRATEALGSKNDPKVNLLHAIKPFLSDTRQNRISDCIKLMQMTSLFKVFNENSKE